MCVCACVHVCVCVRVYVCVCVCVCVCERERERERESERDLIFRCIVLQLYRNLHLLKSIMLPRSSQKTCSSTILSNSDTLYTNKCSTFYKKA